MRELLIGDDVLMDLFEVAVQREDHDEFHHAFDR
jgi:hypothetical protein